MSSETRAFIKGFLSAFDLTGESAKITLIRHGRKRPESDAAAAKSDWTSVGRFVREAARAYGERNKDKLRHG